MKLGKIKFFSIVFILRIIIDNFLRMSAKNINHEMDEEQKAKLAAVSQDINNNTTEDKNKLADEWLKFIREQREKLEEEQKQKFEEEQRNTPQYSNNQPDSTDSDSD